MAKLVVLAVLFYLVWKNISKIRLFLSEREEISNLSHPSEKDITPLANAKEIFPTEHPQEKRREQISSKNRKSKGNET